MSAGVSGAIAQETVELSADQIIVTGTKQGRTVQEVEVSVDIFDEDRFDEENLFDLDDVLARVPNVTGEGAAISIRGISRFGVGNAGQGVTSNVYVDGAPLSSSALSGGLDTLWDVGQVEVLRGPQSTVQGRNSLAGAIVLRTNDPTYDWQFKLRTRYARFNAQQYAGAVSGPIIEDQLAFRIAADFQSTDGFLTNAFTGENTGERDALLLRGKLLIEPNALPDLRTELIVDYNTADAGSQTSIVIADAPVTSPDFLDFDFDGGVTFQNPIQSDTETLRFLADIEYDLSPSLTLKALGTFEDNAFDFTGGDPENPGQLVNVPGGDDFVFQSNTDTYSAELRLEYDFGSFTGSVGGYYFHEDSSDTNDSFSALINSVFFPIDPVDSIVQSSAFSETETTNFAFYTQARYEINDKWTIDFSIRYDNERFATTDIEGLAPIVTPASCVSEPPTFVREILGLPLDTPTVDCNLLATTFAGEGEAPFPEETTFEAILPRGVITYNFNDDFSVFFSGQRGYRAGGTFTFVTTEQLLGTGDGIVPFVTLGTFDPEFLTTYEVGARSVFLDNRLTMNGNVFYSTFKDQQVSVPISAGTGVGSETLNAGQSRLFGAEFSANYQANDTLSLFGSLGLLNTEFVDFPLAATGAFQNLSGNRFPNAPTASFTVGANYEHPIGLFSSASLSFQGPQESNITNLDENDVASLLQLLEANGDLASGVTASDLFSPSITEERGSRSLLNARIGYRTDRFSIAVYGSNLLNDKTPTSVFLASANMGTEVDPDSPTTLQFTDTPNRVLPDPRIFGVVIDFEY